MAHSVGGRSPGRACLIARKGRFNGPSPLWGLRKRELEERRSHVRTELKRPQLVGLSNQGHFDGRTRKTVSSW